MDPIKEKADQLQRSSMAFRWNGTGNDAKIYFDTEKELNEHIEIIFRSVEKINKHLE